MPPLSDISCTAHGDADLRLSQRRSIVHPVAGHADDVTIGLQALYHEELVFRQYLGKTIGGADERAAFVASASAQSGRGARAILARPSSRAISRATGSASPVSILTVTPSARSSINQLAGIWRGARRREMQGRRGCSRSCGLARARRRARESSFPRLTRPRPLRDGRAPPALAQQPPQWCGERLSRPERYGRRFPRALRSGGFSARRARRTVSFTSPSK